MKEECRIILSEVSECLDKVSDDDFATMISMIEKSNWIFCDAKGRSCLMISSFAMRLVQMGKSAYIVSEYTTPAITSKDLLIVCSGSGETTALVNHVKTASKIGCSILLITSNDNSSISGYASKQIILPAGSKISTDSYSKQPLGSLFEQCCMVLFDGLSITLMKTEHISEAEMRARHNNLE